MDRPFGVEMRVNMHQRLFSGGVNGTERCLRCVLGKYLDTDVAINLSMQFKD